jgi:hypothetical protein
MSMTRLGPAESDTATAHTNARERRTSLIFIVSLLIVRTSYTQAGVLAFSTAARLRVRVKSVTLEKARCNESDE